MQVNSRMVEEKYRRTEQRGPSRVKNSFVRLERTNQEEGKGSGRYHFRRASQSYFTAPSSEKGAA